MLQSTNFLAGNTYFVRLKSVACGDCFFDDACYQFYLLRLFNSLNQYRVKLHAYCLVPDEVHLLLTPFTPTGVINFLQSANQQYKQYYMKRFARNSPVFSKTVQFVLLENYRAVMLAQRAVEGLPVARLLVAHPGSHSWSSYHLNAFGNDSGFLARHRAFRKFLANHSDPYSSYRDFVALPQGSVLQMGGDLSFNSPSKCPIY